jgi:DNA polymerase III subunit gamma/tau
MSHQAIYRKYRPKTFEDVVGQTHITDTIKHQIMRKSTAHAYLFSGIRGTGKTSMAKIFARAINCTNNKDGNPCNECESCLSILSERNMDVIEMDAASNNSVEDIRDLREKVKFMPSQSKYKVYIIDEVHMLSKGAFNALLKTLEEPPAHLLFILATTEPQKIPATILSRCQRFDLKRISVDGLMHNMRAICTDMGIEAEDEALRMIANSSEGAMRDALSILDRCLVYHSEKITYEDVINLLGTVNYRTIVNFTDALIDHDIRKVLLQIDEILSEGKEIELFIVDLITHLRNLLILNSVEDSHKFISYGEDAIELMKQQSARLNISDNIRFIEEFSETLALSKKTVNSRILLETRAIGLLSESQALPIKKNVSAAEASTPIKAEKETTQEERPQEAHENQGELRHIKENWDQILSAIKQEKVSLSAIIKEAHPDKIINEILTIKFPEKYTFHYNKANTKESIDVVEKVISHLLNRHIKIRFVIENTERENITEASSQSKKTTINQKALDMFGKDKVEIID